MQQAAGIGAPESLEDYQQVAGDWYSGQRVEGKQPNPRLGNVDGICK